MRVLAIGILLAACSSPAPGDPVSGPTGGNAGAGGSSGSGGDASGGTSGGTSGMGGSGSSGGGSGGEAGEGEGGESGSGGSAGTGGASGAGGSGGGKGGSSGASGSSGSSGSSGASGSGGAGGSGGSNSDDVCDPPSAPSRRDCTGECASDSPCEGTCGYTINNGGPTCSECASDGLVADRSIVLDGFPRLCDFEGQAPVGTVYAWFLPQDTCARFTAMNDSAARFSDNGGASVAECLVVTNLEPQPKYAYVNWAQSVAVNYRTWVRAEGGTITGEECSLSCP